jgi:hypothetical protein
LAIGGSHSRGKPDAFSDLDLYALVDASPDAPELPQAILDWLGTPRLVRGPVAVPHFGFSTTGVFDGLAVCQLNVNTRSTLELNAMRGRSDVVFDRTGYLSSLIETARGLRDDHKGAFEENYVWFWQRALFATRSLHRGEIWRTHRYLTEMQTAMLQLVRLRDGHYSAAEHPHHPATRFELELGPEAGSQIAFAAAPYTCQGTADALADAVAWFESQAGPLLGHSSLPSSAVDTARSIAALVRGAE